METFNNIYPAFILIEPTKKYAIYLTTGCGVVEDPKIDVGFICESDDYAFLKGLSERLQIAYNGFYDTHKSWQSFNFQVQSI